MPRCSTRRSSRPPRGAAGGGPRRDRPRSTLTINGSATVAELRATSVGAHRARAGGADRRAPCARRAGVDRAQRRGRRRAAFALDDADATVLGGVEENSAARDGGGEDLTGGSVLTLAGCVACRGELRGAARAAVVCVLAAVRARARARVHARAGARDTEILRACLALGARALSSQVR